MNDLEWSMAGGMRIEFGESGEEARIAHQHATFPMIRMPSHQCRRDDDSGRETANHSGELESRLGCVDDAGVGEPEIFADAHAEYGRGSGSFLGAELRRASRTHLTLG